MLVAFIHGLAQWPMPCPVCLMEGGFHDHDMPGSLHAAHKVPRDLLITTESLVRARLSEVDIAVLRESAEQRAKVKAYLEEKYGVPAVQLIGTFPNALARPINGLCGNRDDHEPHVHESDSLGTFWCTADQSTRLPFAAERRRSE